MSIAIEHVFPYCRVYDSRKGNEDAIGQYHFHHVCSLRSLSLSVIENGVWCVHAALVKSNCGWLYSRLLSYRVLWYYQQILMHVNLSAHIDFRKELGQQHRILIQESSHYIRKRCNINF
jgi:hypothetical protein